MIDLDNFRMVGGPLDGKRWGDLDPMTNVAYYVGDGHGHMFYTGEESVVCPASDVEHWRTHAQNWEAVARNMAQVLSNTLLHATCRVMTVEEASELADVFRHQCAMHEVTP